MQHCYTSVAFLVISESGSTGPMEEPPHTGQQVTPASLSGIFITDRISLAILTPCKTEVFLSVSFANYPSQ